MALWNDSPDPYEDMRINTDHMSYEELLQLCNRIGNEHAGLKSSDIQLFLRNNKPSEYQSLAGTICCICQYGYKRRAGVGKLNCGHIFHVNCVKQWLLKKIECLVCQKPAHDDEHQTQSYPVGIIELTNDDDDDDDDEEDMNIQDHLHYDLEQVI